MGIISKHYGTLSRFTMFHKPGSNAGFFALNEPPYTIGKLFKCRTPEEFTDYEAHLKTVSFVAMQVPGYRIFFIHAGFEQPPERIIKDRQIQLHLDELCQWYIVNKIEGNKSMSKYKI